MTKRHYGIQLSNGKWYLIQHDTSNMTLLIGLAPRAQIHLKTSAGNAQSYYPKKFEDLERGMIVFDEKEQQLGEIVTKPVKFE